jgi:hypothetical protein
MKVGRQSAQEGQRERGEREASILKQADWIAAMSCETGSFLRSAVIAVLDSSATPRRADSMAAVGWR